MCQINTIKRLITKLKYRTKAIVQTKYAVYPNIFIYFLKFVL